MNHPGGGKNDIANRLKRHFFIFNVAQASTSVVDDIYGQMARGYVSASCPPVLVVCACGA
jgi:dynein heavy chain